MEYDHRAFNIEHPILSLGFRDIQLRVESERIITEPKRRGFNIKGKMNQMRMLFTES